VEHVVSYRTYDRIISVVKGPKAILQKTGLEGNMWLKQSKRRIRDVAQGGDVVESKLQ